MSGVRVVLDTNVLVSGLAYPGSVPGRIVEILRQGEGWTSQEQDGATRLRSAVASSGF